MLDLKSEITSFIAAVILISASESSISNEQKIMQHTDMLHLVGLEDDCKRSVVINLALVRRPHENLNAFDVCMWSGVNCKKGLVHTIEWSVHEMGLARSRIDLDWIPSTVDTATIRRSVSTSDLETRRLPKNAHHINFTGCHIHGTVDLTTLPSNLENLSLRNNDLQGTVRLTHLPKKIKRVDLMGCEITAVVVLMESLPSSLRDICVDKKYPWSLDIISLDGKPVDKRFVFEKKNTYVPLSDVEDF